MINWEISVGNIIEIIVIATGGLWTIFSIRGKVDVISAGIKRLEKRADNMENEVKTLEQALIVIAVQTERLNNQDARMNTLAIDLRELKHGEGFVLPLPMSREPK